MSGTMLLKWLRYGRDMVEGWWSFWVWDRQPLSFCVYKWFRAISNEHLSMKCVDTPIVPRDLNFLQKLNRLGDARRRIHKTHILTLLWLTSLIWNWTSLQASEYCVPIEQKKLHKSQSWRLFIVFFDFIVVVHARFATFWGVWTKNRRKQ